MAQEVLQSILEEEKSAAEAIAAAQRDAVDIIKEAENAARLREREAALESRELYRKLLEDALQQAETDLDIQSAERRALTDAHISKAAALLPQVARLIAEEVIHGNR